VKGLCLALVLALCSVSVAAENWSSFEASLAAFQRDPKDFMNQLPTKDRHVSKFSNNEILSTEFIEAKALQRRACSRGESPDFVPSASPLPNDNVEVFLQGPLRTRNLVELDQLDLKKSELESIPWSGDYWPIAMGILGQRPFDKTFMRLGSWKERYDYFKKNPVHEIVKNPRANLNMMLSASEKYELVLGDSNSFLTQHMWLEGKAYNDEHGNVEEWMGICHGWAPASYMMAGPKKSLTLKSYDQKREVTLYPDELKGLASYLWATSPFETLHIGGRCNDKDPAQDENGRTISKDCFDSNPATWHLAVVHRLGLQKKSFIIDATYDYEVWNQPVVGYSHTYFNPKTKKVTEVLSEAKVEIADMPNDTFKKYRSPEAKSLVGVAMRLGYVVERNVSDNESEPPPYSDVVWVEYMYDLELDGNGDVIGGEWYTNLHPDFLWTPKDGAKTFSRFDSALKTKAWNGKASAPKDWAEVSEASHYHTRQVLTPIVEQLIELSQ
jgi:hypothetical protein